MTLGQPSHPYYVSIAKEATHDRREQVACGGERARPTQRGLGFRGHSAARVGPLRQLAEGATVHDFIEWFGGVDEEQMRDVMRVTVSIDEETYRLARVRAAELDTSVSALVRGYLESLVEDDGSGATATGSRDAEKEAKRRRELMRRVFQDFDARGIGLRMSDNSQVRGSGGGRRRSPRQPWVTAMDSLQTN